VEKGGTILSVVADGTLVKQGDVICELDSADLRDRLIDQLIAVKRAESESKIGQLAHELALASLKEYQEGTCLEDVAVIHREIKRVEANLAVAADRLDELTRLFEKGNTSKATKVAGELSFQEAKFALEIAQTKLSVLQNFTKPNTVKRLIGEVEKARSHELAVKDIFELRQKRADKTRRQIENCRITAPRDGQVVHAHGPARPLLREGAAVRERQLLFTVVPATA
jgi:multidrug resistance efflux pump